MSAAYAETKTLETAAYKTANGVEYMEKDRHTDFDNRYAADVYELIQNQSLSQIGII